MTDGADQPATLLHLKAIPASGADSAQLGHHIPEPKHNDQETPYRKSRHRSLPRLTHALPPKSVAASPLALTAASAANPSALLRRPLTSRHPARLY
jgi:hypothetical protein